MTGSSLAGFAIVYDSLEQAAKTLASNITNETVTVVEHKYGADAANVTQNGMYSVGNIAVSVNNVKNMKIARTLAKATAKEVIKSGSKTDLNVNTSGSSVTSSKSTSSLSSDEKKKKL